MENKIIKFDEYDKEFFDSLSKEIFDGSMMEETEQRFMVGLLRFLNPKNVLEIGVDRGGGSSLILKTLETNYLEKSDALGELISIDILTQGTDLNDKTKIFDIGYKPNEVYSEQPEFLNKHWTLITGYDPSAVIHSFKKKFDFVVIDTDHTHPVESLNFLSILPFLEDGAVVVLHDISLFYNRYARFLNFPSLPFATKILFDTVVGEKFRPFDKISNSKYLQRYPYSNIGAFYVTPDTRKYIKNVFQSLEFPWGRNIAIDIILDIQSLITEFYDEECLWIFKNAVSNNQKLRYNLANSKTK